MQWSSHPFKLVWGTLFLMELHANEMGDIWMPLVECMAANLQNPKPAISAHTKFQRATGVIVFTTAIDLLRQESVLKTLVLWKFIAFYVISVPW